MSSVQVQQGDTDHPRIYVACLASYVSGVLFGTWIDATQDADAIREEIKAMLAASPEPGAEEHAIHDHSGFCGIRIGEYESIDTITELAQLALEHGRLGAEVYEYMGSVEDARRMHEEDYQGAWRSLADWAESFMEDTGGLDGMPENLRCYFDYKAFGRDAELGGDVVTFRVDGDLHVFWSR